MKKLMTCKSCGKEISSKAESCPHCGHSYKKSSKDTNIGCGGLIALIVIIFIIYSLSNDDKPTKATPSKPLTRQELVEKQFSAWDGSHYALERLIKKNLKDPDSYEHIETRFGDKGEYILVYTKYRARNSFGGMVIEEMGAKVDINGNIIEIITN